MKNGIFLKVKKRKEEKKEKRYFAQQRVHLTKKEGIFNSLAKQSDIYQCHSMGRGWGAGGGGGAAPPPPPPPLILTGTSNLVSSQALPAAFRFNFWVELNAVKRLKMLFQRPYISKSSGGACPWTP